MRERRRKMEREGGGEAERRSEREGAAGGYLCLCRAWDGSNRVIIYIDKAQLLQTLNNIKQTSLPTTPKNNSLPSNISPPSYKPQPPPTRHPLLCTRASSRYSCCAELFIPMTTSEGEIIPRSDSFA